MHLRQQCIVEPDEHRRDAHVRELSGRLGLLPGRGVAEYHDHPADRRGGGEALEDAWQGGAVEFLGERRQHESRRQALGLGTRRHERQRVRLPGSPERVEGGDESGLMEVGHVRHRTRLCGPRPSGREGRRAYGRAPLDRG